MSNIGANFAAALAAIVLAIGSIGGVVTVPSGSAPASLIAGAGPVAPAIA